MAFTIYDEIKLERYAQDKRWGEQNHKDGTSTSAYRTLLNMVRRRNDSNAASKNDNWADILLEEVYEALCEVEHHRLREELIQIAAVSICWIQAIDRQK